MKPLRLIGLALSMLFVLAATAASASATIPALLILSGNVSELKATATGKESKLETVGGKTLTGTAVTAELKNCEPLEGSVLDTNLCKDVPIDFTGVKKEKVACRSENAKETKKDAVETVLALLDLHLASEKSTTGVLEPLLIAKALGVELEEEVILNCGGVKEKVKGRIACLLLPGLTQIAAGGTVEILCKQEKGKLITGTCEETKPLCEELANDPFLASLGAGFEGAAMQIHLEGSFNKDIFIDD